MITDKRHKLYWLEMWRNMRCMEQICAFWECNQCRYQRVGAATTGEYP